MLLITGGLGFIGSHIVKRLIREGYRDIIIITRKKNKNTIINKYEPAVKILEVDISWSPEQIIDILKSIVDPGKIDTLIHLAAIVGIGKCNRNWNSCIKVNVVGTKNILDVAIKFDINHIMFASSAAVYGNPIYLPIDEKHPTEPLSLYGYSKLIGEFLFNLYRKAYGIHATIFRMFNIYGPGMPTGPNATAMANFIALALQNKAITIYGGKQQRDFVYIDDVVDAFLYALKQCKDGTYNVGSGELISIETLVKKIIELTDSRSEVIYKEFHGDEIRSSCADISLIKMALGWEPRVPLEIGLKRTIEYFKTKLNN